ncbi:MAG: DNA-binding protein [Rickettsiaceae bacterium]
MLQKPICKQFEKNDEKITTRKVRDILGEGSLTTISEHLKKWRSRCERDVQGEQSVQAVQNHQILGGVSTLLFSICTVTLFWGQATSVYEGIGFKDGDSMALGGVLMVVGFADMAH